MRALRAAATVAAVAAVAACGSGGRAGEPAPGPVTAPDGSGLFAGSGADGVGATVDLEAHDPVTRAVGAVLRTNAGPGGEVPAIGIAAVVNDGPRAVPAPSFVAILDGGGAAPLGDPRDLVPDPGGRAARRALAMLGPSPVTVPSGGAATVYVALPHADPGEVDSVRMVVVPGRPVTLRARSR